MAPGTHALVSWWTANVLPLSRRDRFVVFVAGLLPDADGLAQLHSDEAYLRYHHVLCHHLVGGLILTGVAALLARDRLRCAVMTFLCWHLHLVCDYFGSGGPGEVWVLPYLYPLVGELGEHRFTGPRWYWNPWQWELNAWPNLLVGVIAAIGWLYIAVRLDRTWFEFLWPRIDRELCKALRSCLGGQKTDQWSQREGNVIRRSFLMVSSFALIACVVAGAQSLR